MPLRLASIVRRFLTLPRAFVSFSSADLQLLLRDDGRRQAAVKVSLFLLSIIRGAYQATKFLLF